MKVANIFISIALTVIVGFQSVILYSFGEAVGAFGIVLSISLFMSAVLSWERPYISINFLRFFGVFGLIAGIYSNYTDLILFSVLTLFWSLWFKKSLTNKKGGIL